MNDVTTFVGLTALLLLLLLWARNGRMKRLAHQAVNLAVGPMATSRSAVVPGFDYDAVTSLGDDATQAPISNVTLTVVQSRAAKGPKAGARYVLAVGVNSLGFNPTYEPHVNLIAIEQDPAISKNHLYVEMSGDGTLVVTDRGSRNGTRLNGRRLTANDATTMKPGDTLTVGNTTVKVERAEDAALDELIRITPQYQFRAVKGPATGETWVMNQDAFLIGRNHESDWQLADSKISRLHAEVRREGDLIRVVNRSSNNSMQVNGRPYQSRALEIGDVIKLGDSEIKFEQAYA